MDARIIEIKEEIVNIRHNSARHTAKQSELKNGLNANFIVLKESVSLVQLSVMSLRYLGVRIVQLCYPYLQSQIHFFR